MKAKKYSIHSEYESYDRFCILLICLLNGKCIETRLTRDKKDIETLLSENNIDIKKTNKKFNAFISAKFGKNKKKKIDAILLENCLESFYKAKFLQNVEFKGWRYNSGFLEEAYWLYIRILDSLTDEGGAINFAQETIKKLGFDKCLEKYNRILKNHNENGYYSYLGGKIIGKKGNIYLKNFDKIDRKYIKKKFKEMIKEEKLMFLIFYTIYNIRNIYTHMNFPIPSKLFKSKSILPTTIDEPIGMGKGERNDDQFIRFLDYINTYNDYVKRYNKANNDKIKKILINKNSFKALPSIDFLEEITKLLLTKKLYNLY